MALTKPKKYDWKDSNMEKFGSKEDRAVKKDSAQTEKAWGVVTHCKSPRLFVWRVEKFKIVEVSPQDHGQFYDGDSYIVLNVYKENGSDELEYDVHFWIGKHSTADEYGTAAYKTVELDTFLDDKAIQHREVQEYESDLFKSYFPALTYMKGGIDSGFRHVEPQEYKPRLLHLNGDNKFTVVIKEVKPSKLNLNSGDVFILDLGTELIQWNGTSSNKNEKYSAAKYLNELKGSRNGKATAEVVDEDDLPADHKFHTTLNDEPVKMTPHDKKLMKNGEEDLPQQREKSLLKLTDARGNLNFSSVAKGNIDRKMIDEKDVYIVDNGKVVYVYIGEHASQEERKNALAYAHNYLKQTVCPFSPVTVVGKSDITGRRGDEFNKLFTNA